MQFTLRMNERIASMSIKRKLTVVMIGTFFIAISFYSVAFLVFETIEFLRVERAELQSIARLIATSTEASVDFHDKESAKKILNDICEKTDLLSAYVLFEDMVFAAYSRKESAGRGSLATFTDGQTQKITPQEAASLYKTADSFLLKTHILRSVYIKPSEILPVTVVVTWDLQDLLKMLVRYSFFKFLVIVCLMIIAYFTSKRLHRLISDPIISLTETISKVRQDRNYAFRAIRSSDDEIGMLADCLNQMLEEIEKNSVEMIRYRDKLEKILSLRTTELLLSKDKAELAIQAKTRFIKNVCDELRSPLAQLIELTNFLLGSVVSSEHRELALAVGRISTTQGDIIDRFIAFDVCATNWGEPRLETGFYDTSDAPSRDLYLDETALFVPDTISILYVDPEAAASCTAREMLSRYGYTVFEESDFTRGFTLLNGSYPEIIIFDPDKIEDHDFSFCRAIRTHPRGENVIVLAILQSQDLSIITKAFEAGVTDIIKKPVNWVLLTHRLPSMLKESRIIAELRTVEISMRRYANRLIEVTEELRRRLAAELHDEIGRNLTVLGINLSMISGRVPAAVRAQLSGLFEDSNALIENISTEVNNIKAGLRPPMLDDFGLESAIRWHAGLIAKRSDMEIIFEIDPSFPRLNMDKELALFRISQESLLNASKYSDARHAKVCLAYNSGFIRFSVSDDGKGFTPSSISGRMVEGGWGLTIMHERAAAIGGCFQLESSPGKGTTITVEVREV